MKCSVERRNYRHTTITKSSNMFQHKIISNQHFILDLISHVLHWQYMPLLSCLDRCPIGAPQEKTENTTIKKRTQQGQGPLALNGLTLILAWISNYIDHKACDEIAYPFQKFNPRTIEICEWTSYFIPYFTGQLLVVQIINSILLSREI